MEKKTCQYCRFAHRLEDHAVPQLICDRRPAGRKSYRATHPLNACDAFKPAPARPPLANPNPKERLIPVKGGPHARVDAEDYERVAKYRWCARHMPASCYAYFGGRSLAMHRLILNAPKGLIVDHMDHDGMNNTKRNLRLCTAAENQRHRRAQCKGTSRFKGVSWSRSRRKWCAAIMYKFRTYRLGYFDDEIQAATAYDKKARELHGKFACLNFPEADREKYLIASAKAGQTHSPHNSLGSRRRRGRAKPVGAPVNHVPRGDTRKNEKGFEFGYTGLRRARDGPRPYLCGAA
ncbi:MAG: HNH endonuclease, partial [Phycisphaerae bacterium]|nr:HNH endonuclease [Phycisphaerae bacterium]